MEDGCDSSLCYRIEVTGSIHCLLILYYNIRCSCLFFAVEQYVEFKAGTVVKRRVLRFFVCFQLFGKVTFTVAARFGFKPVYAKGGGNFLLVDPEIQHN